MGDNYGDAWLSVHYDLDTEVRITSPSDEVRQIHGIEPKKFLVLPGTDRRLSDVIKMMDGVTYRGHPTRTEWSANSPQNEEVGSIYPIVLSLDRFVHIDRQLEERGVARVDSSNTLYFEPGELEDRIAIAKRTFIGELSKADLSPEEQKIYCSITGNNPRFD